MVNLQLQNFASEIDIKNKIQFLCLLFTIILSCFFVDICDFVKQVLSAKNLRITAQVCLPIFSLCLTPSIIQLYVYMNKPCDSLCSSSSAAHHTLAACYQPQM